jgi:hypothetical protein
MSGGPGVAQGMNFTFHAGGGSKWAKALRKSRALPLSKIEDWLWTFIDAAISPKNDKSIETFGEPTIVCHGKDSSLVIVDCTFE